MPKEARKLGDKQVSALKKPGLHAVGGVNGLALKVVQRRGEGAQGISRSWVLRVSTGAVRVSSSGRPFAGRRDFGLGGYPDVGLAEARQKAAELRQQIREGLDPIAQRQAERAERLAESAKKKTFEEVARSCFEVRQEEFSNAKHSNQWIRTLETYAFPAIGHVPVSDVTTAQIVELLRPIWLTKHETATRVRQRISAVFEHANHSDLMTGPDPADIKGKLRSLLPKSSAVRKKSGGKKHLPRVDIDGMPDFMKDLRTRKSISAQALDFAILTAARSGEVRGATWGEINLQTRVWTVPAKRMKEGLLHRVPLSDAAVALLGNLQPGSTDELIFKGIKGRQLSDGTLGKMIQDMHYASVKAGGSGYLDPDQQRIAVPHATARSSFKDWSRRKTSWVLGDGSSMSFPDEWSELALAHVNDDETRAAYARDGLLDERRDLMQAWSNFLAGGQ